jgi:pimeloyl-ACP methyl ester carboxylesterase
VSALARKWVVIGQSQGGGAAIYTARYATSFGGRGLDYRGAVGTGTPAYVENVVNAVDPAFIDVGPATNSYLAYIFASLHRVYPKLGLDGILTPLGRKWLKRAETECGVAFEKDIEGVQARDFVTAPVSSLPGFTRTLKRYMAMPESGFDKPFFMGQGSKDTDVPYGLTEPYIEKLKANQQPLTFKLYDSDHSGTLLKSQRDTHPFVRKLFR